MFSAFTLVKCKGGSQPPPQPEQHFPRQWAIRGMVNLLMCIFLTVVPPSLGVGENNFIRIIDERFFLSMFFCLVKNYFVG